MLAPKETLARMARSVQSGHRGESEDRKMKDVVETDPTVAKDRSSRFLCGAKQCGKKE